VAATSDIVIQLDGGAPGDPGGWLDTITDFNFGKPGGTVTLTFTRNIITPTDNFTAAAKIIKPAVKLLGGSTNNNLIDTQTQWVVYYPFQHCIGNFGFPFDAGYFSLSDALQGINDGGRQYTINQVWQVAGQPFNYFNVGPFGGPPARQWSAWSPNGGYSNLFRGLTAASSIAQDYSNFLNEGYPNDPFGANNGAFAFTICDYVRREQVIIKVKVPSADKDFASVKPAFSVTFSDYDGSINQAQTIVPLNPKRPVSVTRISVVGTTLTYGVYAI
jgi:hypothetical protein